ncbi:MAG: PQQ-dependent sugar dehydrogenase [Saprospiraceae bacterium]|nr:PQQ-dependent sugar dehydrogenase [Lewinella sp.]
MKNFLICTILGLGFFFFACQPKSAYSTDTAVIDRGKQVFEAQCTSCHNFLTSGMGPSLAGVTTDVSHDWLVAFIKNPIAVIEGGDERAQVLFAEYKTYMPPFATMPEEDIDAILAYMNTYQATPDLEGDENLGPPLEDPIPDTIPMSGETLVLREVMQIPNSADKGQRARINKMMPLPGTDRLFLHDLRGTLYEVTGGKPKAFLNVPDYFPAFKEHPGHASGLSSFTFHPEYMSNGLFYTNHTEYPDKGPGADFTYEDTIKITVRAVLTEWKQDDPTSSVFSGTKREIMRVDFVTQIHAMQEIAFNPLAKPGDEDYGLLYIGLGDGGAVENRFPFIVQDKSRIWGNIIRIDPVGNDSKNGHYGIPPGNPFVSEMDQGALGEIYAMGFRNAHRMTWDAADGKMLASGIGHHQIEELNIIEPGRNYGWPEREGTFRFDKSGDLQHVYALPEDYASDGFTYPVVQFDHDEAAAISSGFVYYGEQIPALKGKYLFGGIVNGRIFSVEAADLHLGHQSPISEFKVKFEGNPATKLQDITSEYNDRVDLRFGIDSKGEIYVFTKADGRVYKIVGLEGNEM